MFLSKIWFFLITVLAAVAMTAALIMPRPAERAALVQEDSSVRTACLVTQVLLRNDARSRIQLTSEFAQAVRHLKLARTLFETSKDEIVSGQANATGRKELTALIKDVSGGSKPSFVWLLDKRGRIVARSNLKNTNYGHSVRGYRLVQDALDGYVRDDLWMMKTGLFRVAAAPVLTQSLEWAGAVVVGQAMDKKFSVSMSENISANITFYVDGKSVAANEPIQIHKDVLEGAKELVELDEGQGCNASTILHIKAGAKRYAAVNAGLPGEAGEQGAFYSVYIERAKPLDFIGMLKATKKGDLSPDRFPWVMVIGLFVSMMGVGFFLTLREVDRPLKKLNANAVALAQSETERLDELAHRGKYGSIARSVNIAIDKMHRDAKAAKKDLDQLLGPATGIDAGASALPPVGPGGLPGAVTTPPPSEFKFGGPVPESSPELVVPSKPSSISDFPELGGNLSETPPVAAASSGPAKTPPPPIPSAKATPLPSAEKESIELKRPTDSHQVPASIDADILGPAGSAVDPEDAIPKKSGGGSADIAAADVLGSASLDGDLLGPSGPASTSSASVDEQEEMETITDSSNVEAVAANYFEQIYQEFIALKKKCGEPTEKLTFDRFSKKLQKNQDALIAKHSCSSVKFQVYKKDGKAALKASPVR